MRNGKNNTEQRHGHRQIDYNYLVDVVGTSSKITHKTLLQNDTNGFSHLLMCNLELQVNTRCCVILVHVKPSMATRFVYIS
jgi:hypothetical protein